MNQSRPRLCLIGPMTGQRPGGLPTQGEFLASLLAREGYPVKIVSTQANRYLRLCDVSWTLISKHAQFDVILPQVFSGNAFILTDISSLIGRLTHKRIIIYLRGGNFPVFSRKHTLWVNRVFKRADFILAPSNYLANQLSWLGFPIRIIPNVIDISSYPFNQRDQAEPRILWMRSFQEIYHPEMAIRALAHLLPSLPSATMSMAGPDMGLLAPTQQLAEELGVDEKVNFPGFLSPEGKLKAGATHDIYINTNRIDNMPISILEMGAMGLPVVSTAVGGIPDLLTNEKDVLLVPDGDYKKMAEAILRLIKNPGLVKALSLNGRKLAEQFQWENVKDQWEYLLTRK